MRLYTIHETFEEHLHQVIEAMRTLGAPTVRVVNCRDYYMAIEGTHRIAAACQLGLAPELDILEQDDLVPSDSLDLDNLAPGETYTAGEIAGEVYSPLVHAYDIDDDGYLTDLHAA